MGKKSGKLCKLEKDGPDQNADLIQEITKKSKYECDKCNRAAAKERNLCKPVSVKKKKKQKKDKRKGEKNK